MNDHRFNLPNLTAAQLGKVTGLTERQVKDRVAKGQFICHWTGGTPAHPRGMRFTPAEVEHNRNVCTRHGAVQITPTATVGPIPDDKARKGVARIRRAHASTGLQRPTAA